MLHTTAGYLIYAATTFKYVFDYHPPDVYWCTADVGWITGHTYVVYGPLANGATSVIVSRFQGINFPSMDGVHQIDRFRLIKSDIRVLLVSLKESNKIDSDEDVSPSFAIESSK